MTPEFIKLDRSLVSGIDVDPAKRALATAVVAFATEMGAIIVAEGIETGAEYRAARQLGIHAAQGYLFGRPTADWATWVEWHANGPLLAGRHR
jgi:EAL domain-containing protein (putative c-di-GMP-specific phosphodiesterase class I)